jgi:mono/diheme cytochrome c family protein
MKNALTIALFTLLVTLFYRHVGQLVPQKEVPAPETIEVGSDLSTEEMVGVGKKIVDAKCMSCHGIQPRFPSLAGIGARAGKVVDGYSDVDYLAEALYEPNAYIAEGFAAGMTPANKPPLNLTDDEVLTVIAFLQSLGGTPSVTMKTELKYQGSGAAAPAAQESAGDSGEKVEFDPKKSLTDYGCIGCHSFTGPEKGLGPSLYDIGKLKSKSEIYTALMDPDAEVAEGFVPGVMGATLNGNGFYAKLSAADLKKLVDHLAEMKGE